MRIIHCSDMPTNKGKSLRRGSCVAGGPNGESCKTLSIYKTYPSILFPIAVVNLRDICSGLNLFVAIAQRQAFQSSILCSVHFDESSSTMRQDIARDRYS